MNRELMFAALSATNEAILRSKSPAELYSKACDAVVYGGHMDKTLIPWREHSLACGVGATLAVPVVVDGRPEKDRLRWMPNQK